MLKYVKMVLGPRGACLLWPVNHEKCTIFFIQNCGKRKNPKPNVQQSSKLRTI